MFETDQSTLLFLRVLHFFKLRKHGYALTPHGYQHPKINGSNDKSGYYIALKPPVRLWGQLDSLDDPFRLALILVGMGLGLWLIAWGVRGDGWGRFAFGFGSGLMCFVFGGNVLFDWFLRWSSK
jgi:hypothetical protein